MGKFIIKGGQKLTGTIQVRGAKNAALKMFAAALLTNQEVTLKNVPEVEDVIRTVEILKDLGCLVEHPSHGIYKVTAKNITTSTINPEISKQLRASVALTAPILVRTGEVLFPHPGGCVIGKRPIDVFLDGFAALGAEIFIKNDNYHIKTSGLLGSEFFFNTISVTGTETMILAAVLAKGTTILKNCACEPEISSLVEFLNQCGAKIKGAGTPTIAIQGVKNLKGGIHTIIPDRIEAGSFAILAATCGSDVTIENCNPEHLESLWHVFNRMGISVKKNKTSVQIKSPKRFVAADIKTHEHPGFPTDLQAPICVLLTQAEGTSLVHETIYEGRLYWTEDLKRMGADILLFDPHRVQINGPAKLTGRDIESPDLRAGMAFIIAALCAQGTTTLENIYQIDRGYERIEERLKKIGADIKRI